MKRMMLLIPAFLLAACASFGPVKKDNLEKSPCACKELVNHARFS